MEKILIPQLAKSVDATETISFKESIDGLETLTPVEGILQVTHQGSFLEVKARASTIVTLTCDRTLVQFNHRLEIDTSELIWLSDQVSSVKEQEIDFEDLVEALSPKGYFDPAEWLYEQLSLAIPYRKIAPDAPELSQILDPTNTTKDQVDKRWSVLKALKQPELN